MRVYGALMWSLGKVMQTPEVYIGGPECVFIRGLSDHPEATVACSLVIGVPSVHWILLGCPSADH